MRFLRGLFGVVLFLAALASGLLALLGLIVVIVPSETATRGDGVVMVIVFLILGLALLVGSGKVLPEPTPAQKEAQAEASKKRAMKREARRRERRFAVADRETKVREKRMAAEEMRTADRDANRTATRGDSGVPRRSRAESFAPPVASAAGSQGSGHMVGGDWVPATPQGEQLDPWGRGVTWSDINGVWYHRETLRRFLSPLPEFSQYGSGARLDEPITLTYDGDNPFSSNGHAVAAFLRGQHIGYLPDDETPTWGPILHDLQAEGFDLRVPGNVWGHDAEYGEHYNARVHLPNPSELTPSNGLPSTSHVIIPNGRKRQVTKEEDHLDVLSKLVIPDGVNHVAAVLRSIIEVRARSAPEIVQVEIDGHRVGILSDVQSKNMLPLVKYIEARGKLAVCRAEVQGTAIKADVVLYCADAGEVGAAWLNALGPEIPKPTEVIPGPDWDWDDEPMPADRSDDPDSSRQGPP
ncbi:hypothetical protein [Actinomyces provencensis]|uniref:hypothetical protein n=1 Tax=Actinomyces provencensis TaxID=1720198 RepID=UPI001178AC26|nr:hypothetical protein [Actinomyces provencensis]